MFPPWTSDHHLKLTRKQTCWMGFMCLWCGYLQLKWNNKNSAQAGFHYSMTVIALLLCHTGFLFVPTRSAGQATGAVRGKKKLLFQLCDWGQPVLYRPHPPHLHSPTALNYPLRFLRETEWQLGPVQQWESGGSRGLAEKSIHKWINCTNNSS